MFITTCDQLKLMVNMKMIIYPLILLRSTNVPVITVKPQLGAIL